MSEQWHSVVGFEGMYEVSDEGRVRNATGRLLTPFLHTNGRLYPKVTLTREGRPFSKLVHILVLEAFVGPRPIGCEALHFDDRKANCSLRNLRWGTRAENTADRQRNGIYKRGEKHCRAKLSDQQRRQIGVDCAAGTQTQRQIAKQYGVSQMTIWRYANAIS